MDDYVITIIIGVTAGTLARLVLLRIDYRHYPGYPHGFITHIALGLIASALGAVAVPALLKPDFTAVTFLALAAQQLREVRNMERLSLAALEQTELVKRGPEYIEGIARTFEARNYLAMGTALVAGIVNQFAHWFVSIIVALVVLAIVKRYMTGKTIGDICDVLPAKPYFENTLLTIEKITIMEVGLSKLREEIIKDSIGVIIKPKDDNARNTIHNVGQRMAIIYTAATILGTKKDVDIPEYTPLTRKDADTGCVVLYIMPAEPDVKALVEAVNRTPVLESSQSKPLKAKAGRIAAD